MPQQQPQRLVLINDDDGPRVTTSSNAPDGGGADMDASPAGAFAFFADEDGTQAAWLDTQGDAPAGFVRGDARDPGTTQRFDDTEAWQARVDELGMTEGEAPETDPADADEEDSQDGAGGWLDTLGDATWAVTDADGEPADSLDGLAHALGTGREEAARALLSSRLAGAAPPALFDEAVDLVGHPAELSGETQGTERPGEEEGKAANNPPPIDTGSYVSWSNGTGRVDMVVTNGTVPGVDSDLKGTTDSPVARVVVWEPDGDGHSPTRRKTAARVSSLRRIPPLTRPSKGKDATAALVEMLGDHDQHVTDVDLPDWARAGGHAVKTVYGRGENAWPGEEKTALSRQQWALGRVAAFLRAAAGETTPGYVRDVDMLPDDHPARS